MQYFNKTASLLIIFVCQIKVIWWNHQTNEIIWLFYDNLFLDSKNESLIKPLQHLYYINLNQFIFVK